MVERQQELDAIFGSLADGTRRDILGRVAKREMSVGEIAARYDLTFAMVSKHLKVLESAKLVTKTRRGKQQFVALQPRTLAKANRQIERYRREWSDRFERLDKLLEEESK